MSTAPWRPGYDFRTDVVTEAFSLEQRTWLEDRFTELKAILDQALVSGAYPVQFSMVQTSDQRYSLGTICGFDSHLGFTIHARYVKFTNVHGQTLHPPVGPHVGITGAKANEVTDDFANAIPVVKGFALTAEPIKENHFGWIQITGPNYHTVTMGKNPATVQGDSLEWSGIDQVQRWSSGNPMTIAGLQVVNRSVSAGQEFQQGEIEIRLF